MALLTLFIGLASKLISAFLHWVLRARAKITSHFGISSSGHFRQILKSKNLEIVHYYCAFYFLKSTKPNLNLSAKNVKLFLREPLGDYPLFDSVVISQHLKGLGLQRDICIGLKFLLRHLMIEYS